MARYRLTNNDALVVKAALECYIKNLELLNENYSTQNLPDQRTKIADDAAGCQTLLTTILTTHEITT